MHSEYLFDPIRKDCPIVKELIRRSEQGVFICKEKTSDVWLDFKYSVYGSSMARLFSEFQNRLCGEMFGPRKSDDDRTKSKVSATALSLMANNAHNQKVPTPAIQSNLDLWSTSELLNRLHCSSSSWVSILEFPSAIGAGEVLEAWNGEIPEVIGLARLGSFHFARGKSAYNVKLAPDKEIRNLASQLHATVEAGGYWKAVATLGRMDYLLSQLNAKGVALGNVRLHLKS